MNHWELVWQQYPTKLELTEPETHHLTFTTKESFATNVWGKRILFAKFGSEAIYSRGVGHSWKFKEDWEIVGEETFKAAFVDYKLVKNLDHLTGTAELWGTQIKYDKRNNCWVYLNNWPVNFHTPSECNTPAEEEDTIQVEELLETTERTIVTTTQKLSLGQPSRPQTLQTGLVFWQTRPTSALSVLRSDPTPTFSYTAPSIYTPTYEAPNTWDCITMVSDFPDVVPAHPLDILPCVAPEPVTIRSLMRRWPYTTHHFTEFRPRRTDGDSTELWLALHGHFTHAHTLEHSTFCREHVCPTHFPYGSNRLAK